MASNKEYLDFILGQLSEVDGVSYRPMMGEYLLYVQGKLIGGIYDDRFLVKRTKSALEFLPEAEKESPYEGAKEMLLVDNLDNKQLLQDLLQTMAKELSPAKKKR